MNHSNESCCVKTSSLSRKNREMGIPQFARWLLNQDLYGVAIDTVPGGVHWMFVDFPSMIHDAAKVEAKSASEEGRLFDESKFHMILESNIMEKVTYFSPSELIYFAQDGMAPLGKIIQQRERRYDFNGVDSVRGEQEILEEDKEVDKKSSFDRNAITPGTHFMERLSERLQTWFKTNKNLFPKVIYSPQNVSGEGEHKIYDFLREHVSKRNKNKVMRDGSVEFTPNVVVLGLDTDLILMSVLNIEIKRLFLVRQEVNFVLNIDNLRGRLRGLMGGSQTAISDFVLLVLLTGRNDFLPTIESLSDIKFGLDVMIQTYNKLKLSLTRGLTKIEWRNLRIYLEKLSIMEKKTLLPVLSKRTFKFSSPIFDLSNYDETKEDTRTVYEMPLNRLASPQRNFSFEKFESLWYSKALEVRGLDKISLSMLSETPKRAFESPDPNPKDFLSEDVLKVLAPSGEELKSVISHMVEEYLTTVSWILAYFKGGHNSVNEYYYRYFHAPTVTDLYRYFPRSVKGVEISFEKPLMNPLISLPIVIPPQSSSKVPSSLTDIYTSSLIYMFPYGHTYDLVGKDVAHLKKKIIVSPDILAIAKYVISNIKITRDSVKNYAEGKDVVFERDNPDGEVNFSACKVPHTGVRRNFGNEKMKFKRSTSTGRVPKKQDTQLNYYGKKVLNIKLSGDGVQGSHGPKAEKENNKKGAEKSPALRDLLCINFDS